MFSPNISVIINTNGRCLSLMRTVAALKWQRYSNFELCIVAGPKDDGTREFGQELARSGEAKFAKCPVENLSVSRNIGLDLAAGELVAFIDDDAIPEPVWLEQLSPKFADEKVAGASGLVFHPNGRDVQFRYSVCDRFGETTHLLRPELGDSAYPHCAYFPHVMGANCIFRRDAVLAVGGFDEEYEYYLEEADLCCRLVDEGHKIAHAEWAPVHHKYMAGVVRDSAGITINRKPIIKNQIYFSAMNARQHASIRELISRCETFTNWHRSDIAQHVNHGRLPAKALSNFDRDAEEGWEVGLVRGLSQQRRLRERFASPPPFAPFPSLFSAESGKHIAVLQIGEPEAIRPLQSFAKPGNIVRSFEPLGNLPPEAEGPDFIDDVWRHRVSPQKELNLAPTARPNQVETRAGLIAALDRIAAYHPFDEVIDFTR